MSTRDRRPATRPPHAFTRRAEGRRLAADVEAEPGAADAAGEVRIESEELLEDPRLLGRGDSEAAVVDADPNAAAGSCERDAHAPAVGRVLDGVVDEVGQHLTELFRICGDRR